MCETLDLPRSTYYQLLNQTISNCENDHGVGYKSTRKCILQTKKPHDRLIFHSDLGTQYTSNDFKKIIKNFNMTHSFSCKGRTYDNACIESFHAILKKEEINHIYYLD